MLRRLINKALCSHQWHYEGELAWFTIAGPHADRYFRLVCSKCEGHKNVLAKDWPKIRDKQTNKYKSINGRKKNDK